MLIASGTLLVLLTWGVLALFLISVGLPAAILTHSGRISLRDVRHALWWGLSIFAITAMFTANVVPLISAGARWIFAGVIALGLVGSWVLFRKRGWAASARITAGSLLVISLAFLVLTYLAIAALGPVTNFDSGLYHLSAIGVAQEFAAIPGLANLHAPLGYANASFPMAAALGVTPWGTESYRLLNGLIIGLVLVDLILRWVARRRTAGAYGLLVGAVVLVIPMVALSDYWVTSPSQDAAVFAVVVAVSAMVMQSVADPRHRIPEMAAAISGGIALVLLRPTMLAFSAAAIAVCVVMLMRSRVPGRQWIRASVLVALVAVLGGVAQVARDYVLSGWFLYPLSVMPFDVPWRAPDPLYLRTATLGYHRDPTDLWQAAEGWNWVGSWLAQLPMQWEFWLIIVLIMSFLGTLIATTRSGTTLRIRAMLMATVPSAVMVVVWWVATPPSFRFAWGPIFTLATVPMGWIMWRAVEVRATHSRKRWSSWIAALALMPAFAVIAFSVAVRLDWDSMTSPREWSAGLTIPYVVSAAPFPPTDEIRLEDGVTIYVPVDGEACWAARVPCTSELDARLILLNPSRGFAGGLAHTSTG